MLKITNLFLTALFVYSSAAEAAEFEVLIIKDGFKHMYMRVDSSDLPEGSSHHGIMRAIQGNNTCLNELLTSGGIMDKYTEEMQRAYLEHALILFDYSMVHSWGVDLINMPIMAPLDLSSRDGLYQIASFNRESLAGLYESGHMDYYFSNPLEVKLEIKTIDGVSTYVPTLVTTPTAILSMNIIPQGDSSLNMIGFLIERTREALPRIASGSGEDVQSKCEFFTNYLKNRSKKIKEIVLEELRSLEQLSNSEIDLQP